jgi:small conductance mechanosensitive channel
MPSPLVGSPSGAVPRSLDDACGAEPGALCRWVYERTGNEFLATATDWLVERPLRIVLIVVAAWVLARMSRRAITRTMQRLETGRGAGLVAADPRARGRVQTLTNLFRSVVTVTIWVLAVLVVLGELDINLGPLVAGAGIAGVALGFGAQSLVKDFLSGVFMVLEDQYGVGDVVDLGDAVGTVEQVSLRSTRLRGVDGTVWHVPNGEIRRVGNKSQNWSRALLDVAVGYATDLAHARQVILEVATEVCGTDEHRATVLEPPEVWGVENLGADGVALRLVVKTTPGDQWALMRSLRAALKDRFDREGIEIPHPQRALHVRGDTGAAGPAREPSGGAA